VLDSATPDMKSFLDTEEVKETKVPLKKEIGGFFKNILKRKDKEPTAEPKKGGLSGIFQKVKKLIDNDSDETP